MEETELYKKYRPASYKQVLGNPDAIRTLMQFDKTKTYPHAMLFTGNSGGGKTSLARIVRNRLGCSDPDFTEINTADNTGVDPIRDIRRSMSLAPMDGPCRVWLWDEAHMMTGNAQNALLKMLEDTPKHVYFMLASTDPQKLIAAIRNRCTEVRVKPLLHKISAQLLQTVSEKEGFSLDEEVRDRIIEVAEGSGRKLLVLLGSIIGIESTEEQLSMILSSDSKRASYELFTALMNGSKWPEVVKILSSVDEEPESLRRMVLGMASNSIRKPGKHNARAYLIINAFRDNFYDCGKAGLDSACWEVVSEV